MMLNWQELVIDEKNELDAKLLKLRAFIGGTVWTMMDAQDQCLLGKQLMAMNDYFTALTRRIERFIDTKQPKPYVDTRVP